MITVHSSPISLEQTLIVMAMGIRVMIRLLREDDEEVVEHEAVLEADEPEVVDEDEAVQEIVMETAYQTPLMAVDLLLNELVDPMVVRAHPAKTVIPKMTKILSSK